MAYSLASRRPGIQNPPGKVTVYPFSTNTECLIYKCVNCILLKKTPTNPTWGSKLSENRWTPHIIYYSINKITAWTLLTPFCCSKLKKKPGGNSPLIKKRSTFFKNCRVDWHQIDLMACYLLTFLFLFDTSLQNHQWTSPYDFFFGFFVKKRTASRCSYDSRLTVETEVFTKINKHG